MRGLNYPATTAVALFSLANVAAADGEEPPSHDGGQWLVGPGLLARSKPYRDVDAYYLPLPYVAYFGERFFFEMNEIGYSLAETQDYRIGLIASIRLEGYDGDDSDALTGMAKRKSAADGGAQFSVSGGWGEVEFTGLTDLSSTHNGHELSATYSKSIKIDYTMITPALGVRWKSDELMDYYYGVRQHEAKEGRAAYQANAAISWYAEVEVIQPLTEKWLITVDAIYEKFAEEYTDSPVVEDDYRARIFSALVYRF